MQGAAKNQLPKDEIFKNTLIVSKEFHVNRALQMIKFKSIWSLGRSFTSKDETSTLLPNSTHFHSRNV